MGLHRIFVFGSVVFFALGLVACNKTGGESAMGGTAQESAVAKAEPAGTPTVDPAAAVYITQAATLKRAASNQAKVDDGKGKQVSNWLATLYRGEKVNLAKDAQGGGSNDYRLVKTSNDMTGWIKKSALLTGIDVREAVTSEQIEIFDRPDMLALNTKKKVPAGTLLFVTKQREPFSEVNIGDSQSGWVLSTKLVSDAKEIMVAKLFAKARAMRDSKSGSAEELVKLARSNFSDARLVEVMEREFGVFPASAAYVEAAPLPEPESAVPVEKPVAEQ